jgi:iron complex outermembrane receptor protein
MKKGMFLLSLVLTSYVVFAQSVITGRILDTKTGNPITGASIKIKGGHGTSTDNEGYFKVQAAAGQTLEFTSIGYQPQVLILGSENSLVIKLEPASTNLAEMVVVGSRGAPRSKLQSPVPVDVIGVNSLSSSTAKPDLMSQLNMLVPSFNYNKQSGGDGSDAIDFASLRGLGFDQTLVLINGKRQHTSAFVNEVGTRGRGNSGTDLNAIPEAAIDHIEILRDGASAQYGSDAIAGVINIILKKDVNHLTFDAGWGGYYDHKYNTLNSVDPSQYYTGSPVDGNTFATGANYGVSLGKNGGFLNIGANFRTNGKTFRQDPDTNWTTNPNALSTNTWRRAAGDGSVTATGAMYNLELPIAGTHAKFYSFGGWNYKHSNVYAWTRNYSGSPQKFPTNPDGSLIFDPSIMRVAGASDGTISPDNVYWDPEEDVYIKDVSMANGFSGTLANGWDWDISNVTGYNNFHYFGGKTFNATLDNIPGSLKTRFNDGGFSFLQNTANIDIDKRFAGVAQGMTLAFGGEYRYERYKLYAGEPDSYGYADSNKIFPGADTTKPASGSEGYPGYTPGDATTAHRSNVGVYGDIALDITNAWLVDGAIRYEHYSDFGSVTTYKFATRYKVTSDFNLRGSISTGFRAPSLQQLNFSNTNTNIISVGGTPTLEYIKLVPNYSPIARAVGIPPLKQETSVNGSLGFAWQPVHNLTVTVDGYWIQMKDRIVITGNFGSAITELAPVLASNTPPLYAANFFVNAVNTTNTGVDVVVDYTKRWGKSSFHGILAGNIQNIAINKINIPGALDSNYLDQQAFFSTREQYFLKASAPRAKFSLALEYNVRKFTVGTHLTYFGKVVTQGFGYASLPGAPAGGPGGAGISDQGNGWDPYVVTDDGKSVVPEDFVFHGKITTDLYVAFKLSKTCSWTTGVDNLFNVHPDLAVTAGAHMASWGDSESGGAFDAVQMGFDGLHAFTKLSFRF